MTQQEDKAAKTFAEWSRLTEHLIDSLVATLPGDLERGIGRCRLEALVDAVRSEIAGHGSAILEAVNRSKRAAGDPNVVTADEVTDGVTRH